MPDRDWMQLIDKKAALKEQFPPLRRLMHERPGSLADRDNRARFEAENRESLERSRLARERRRAAEENADRFIRDMERRKRERFLARLEARREHNPNERKSA